MDPRPGGRLGADLRDPLTPDGWVEYQVVEGCGTLDHATALRAIGDL